MLIVHCLKKKMVKTLNIPTFPINQTNYRSHDSNNRTSTRRYHPKTIEIRLHSSIKSNESTQKRGKKLEERKGNQPDDRISEQWQWNNGRV